MRRNLAALSGVLILVLASSVTAQTERWEYGLLTVAPAGERVVWTSAAGALEATPFDMFVVLIEELRDREEVPETVAAPMPDESFIALLNVLGYARWELVTVQSVGVDATANYYLRRLLVE